MYVVQDTSSRKREEASWDGEKERNKEKKRENSKKMETENREIEGVESAFAIGL